jgi:hypothetical protein
VASPAHTWQFFDHTSNWKAVSPVVSTLIDGAVASGAATVRYRHGTNSYELVLATLIQTNTKSLKEPTGTRVQRELRVVDAANQERVRGVIGGAPVIRQ